MCGIFGVVNFLNGYSINETAFSEALATLRHRGPDARCMERLSENVIFGHTRLSIIGLSDKNNQPMSIQDRYSIVFNGEIFNYLELRAELEANGVMFHTDGDTEVLLNAYILWGEQCVHKFNGMWAFAIYDKISDTLFCSRDRFGIKPFNYTLVDGQLLFASEIKAMLAYKPSLATPNYDVISNFCRTSVGAQIEQTWFKNVFRLLPGHNLLVTNGKACTTRYWHYPADSNESITFEDACTEYARLFEDAVELRMRSDVPLGLTLSSGIDSSTIAYIMNLHQPSAHHCFTSRFNSRDKFETDLAVYNRKMEIDESVTAAKIADEIGLRSHIVDTNYENMASKLENIIYYLESGNSAPAVIPLMQLMNVATKHVKVVLEGQGADEMLGGYIFNMLWPTIFESIRRGNVRAAWQMYKQFSSAHNVVYSFKMLLRDISNDFNFLSVAHQRISGSAGVYGPLLKNYSRIRDYADIPNEGRGGVVSRLLMRQHSGGLVNLLHYGDAISMANSIEARVPFMDYKLVEFVWSLPTDYKVRLGYGKYIHRKAMEDIVPKEILFQKMKLGFNTPIGEQFRKSPADGNAPVNILLSERCLERGIFDPEGMKKLIDAHCSGQKDHGPLLYRLLSVELWFRRFIDA